MELCLVLEKRISVDIMTVCIIIKFQILTLKRRRKKYPSAWQVNVLRMCVCRLHWDMWFIDEFWLMSEAGEQLLCCEACDGTRETLTPCRNCKTLMSGYFSTLSCDWLGKQSKAARWRRKYTVVVVGRHARWISAVCKVVSDAWNMPVLSHPSFRDVTVLFCSDSSVWCWLVWVQ